MKADITVKRVYEAACPNDGARILVDRIWPRGLSKDQAALTSWRKEIAPSTGLRRWFGHDRARWDEFQRRYAEELDRNSKVVGEFEDWLRAGGRVTLLYAARDETHNHALVLERYLRDRLESRKAK